jgi:hypothetical protein
MAATAEIRVYNGASSGTPSSDIQSTTIRFKRADNQTQDLNDPIPLPASGENLSWSKYSKIRWTTTPSGSITNLRFFVAAPPSGIKHYAWTNSTYAQGASGDEAGISGKTDTQPNKDANDEDNHSSGSPLTVNAGTVLSNPSTGEGTQDFVIQQLGVLSTYSAGGGVITSFQATYRYAET